MKLTTMSQKELQETNGGFLTIAFVSLCVAVFGITYKVAKEY